MRKKQIQDRLNKLFRKANEKPRLCNANGCEKMAINSHILQKNGPG